MATSRLATHLPALFGPSRRAAWRLSLVRRCLAAAALLLALHLALGATGRATGASSAPPDRAGPALTLPLAAPADHLRVGDAVGIYLPGQDAPVVADARVLAVPDPAGAGETVRVSLPPSDVGSLVRQMSSEVGGGTGFVVVRRG